MARPINGSPSQVREKSSQVWSTAVCDNHKAGNMPVQPGDSINSDHREMRIYAKYHKILTKRLAMLKGSD
jgi:hypothetical protein